MNKNSKLDTKKWSQVRKLSFGLLLVQVLQLAMYCTDVFKFGKKVTWTMGDLADASKASDGKIAWGIGIFGLIALIFMVISLLASVYSVCTDVALISYTVQIVSGVWSSVTMIYAWIALRMDLVSERLTAHYTLGGSAVLLAGVLMILMVLVGKNDKRKDLSDRRRSAGEKLFFIAAFSVLAIWSAIMIYMLFWAIVSSLRTNLDFVREPLQLPKLNDLKWENFSIAIEDMEHNGIGFIGMLINSLWLVVGSTFIGTLTICITGYVFAQYDFKGKNFMMAAVMFIILIPIYGALPATYKLFYDLNLNDSPMFLIASFSGFNANMLITYGFYKGLPKAYREAVYMDGGGDFAAFFKIGLPMGKNIFIAFFLLNFIAGWNNYETPILYFDKMPNIASGLYYFQQRIQYEANNPAYFAGALMAMIPVLVLFVCFADKIMGQMYTGGLKG